MATSGGGAASRNRANGADTQSSAATPLRPRLTLVAARCTDAAGRSLARSERAATQSTSPLCCPLGHLRESANMRGRAPRRPRTRPYLELSRPCPPADTRRHTPLGREVRRPKVRNRTLHDDQSELPRANPDVAVALEAWRRVPSLVSAKRKFRQFLVLKSFSRVLNTCFCQVFIRDINTLLRHMKGRHYPQNFILILNDEPWRAEEDE